MSTKRFSNVDGVNAPELGAWTVQETAAYPGPGSNRVFPVGDRIHTPVNVRGWTVQVPAAGTLGGSDQGLTAHKGVHQ